MAGTINDINNLKFYTAKGYEIPMAKSYVLTWEFIPGNFASKYVLTPISGYFIGNIDASNKIKSESFETGFINNGEIYARYADNAEIDENGMQIFAYNSTSNLDIYNYIRKIFLDKDNLVKVSINIKNESYSHTFLVSEIFNLTKDTSTENIVYEDYITSKTIYTGENISEIQNEYYKLFGLKKIELFLISEKPYILKVFEENVPNIGIYFPFIRYAGDFYLERVSTDFIATDTLLVLEECESSTGNIYYTLPYIVSDSQYSLVFQPSSEGELKIIDSTSKYEIKYIDEAAFSLANEGYANKPIPEPFAFPIAFKAETEGAYQNLLGIYLRNKDANDNENTFFMGAISVKSEVEGEDERFRTLLTNFGIPDPAYYSNIFAEQDYQEEGKDYKLINKKSKELMLTYDLIFSYVGTYKALIRAIKFLGYQDIIFKEWYSIKDTNDKITDVAILVFDSSNGTFLKLKLADFGISIEDFNNYNKLNKISMIYHFNERSEEVEKINVVNVSDGSIGKPYTKTTEVPLTKPVFIYRNAEILTKLFAVKQWLELHIIGVGAYIADITGEGIYFGWQKTLGYQTQHHLNDFSLEQYYTPKIINTGEFKNSSAYITCTFNELNKAVRIIDYDDTAIASFIKKEIPISYTTDTGEKLNVSTLALSNSLEAPVLGDEYEFDLVVRPDSGTLYEWTNHIPNSSNNSIPLVLIQDGKMNFLNFKDLENEAYIECPIITLENANIHTAYGDWKSNIKWSIREVIDSETGNSKYKLLNINYFLQTSKLKILDLYVVLEPITDVSSIHPYVKFSEKNKWGLPLFIIHGYKFGNVNCDPSVEKPSMYNLIDSNTADTEYVLEIMRGDIWFKNNSEFNCGCLLAIDSELNQSVTGNYSSKIYVQPIYTYHSEKIPFVNLNVSNGLSYEIICNEEMQELSTNISNKINNEFLSFPYIIELYNSYRQINIEDDVAYNEASSFINSSLEYKNSINEFINVVLLAKLQEMMEKHLEEDISENYKANKAIDIKVNRLGNYELISRAFDKYNNMFPAKYDNTVNITCAPIYIDTISSVENSGNKENFYRFNIDGKLLDASLLDDISSNYKNPTYPKPLHTYDIDYDLKNNEAEFDNILNIIDTPNNCNTCVFDTLNERVIEVEKIVDTNIIRLHMLDGNPNKIGLYTIADNKKVSIHVYEYKSKSIVFSLLNCLVSLVLYEEPTKNICYTSSSFIDILIDNAGNVNTVVETLNNYAKYDALYKVIVLNTTEYPIKLDSSTWFSLNYEDKETYIILETDDLVFNSEDVVKIRYYMNVSTYEGDPSSGKLSGNIINETAYRILDAQETYRYVDDFTDVKCFKYTLNGLLNTLLLNNPNVSTYITYAAEMPVRYSAKVIGNANEYNQIIGYGNYSLLRDEFKFNTSLLFLNNYIDDTYGLEITDYDYYDCEKYWLNLTEYMEELENIEDLNLYYYHLFPITIEQGNSVLFKANDENNVLNEFKTDWKVSVFSVDELANIPENINVDAKETLFRSTNNMLYLKPYMLGSHDIELTCTDIFGNRVVNKGEGMLYIKK